jgi:hypothetical protein
MNNRYYLGDGEHYFIIRSDKYSGAPVAELFNPENKGISLLTVDNRSIHDLINYFEVQIMEF